MEVSPCSVNASDEHTVDVDGKGETDKRYWTIGIQRGFRGYDDARKLCCVEGQREVEERLQLIPHRKASVRGA